jgi:hypothetical protein
MRRYKKRLPPATAACAYPTVLDRHGAFEQARENKGDGEIELDIGRE